MCLVVFCRSAYPSPPQPNPPLFSPSTGSQSRYLNIGISITFPFGVVAVNTPSLAPNDIYPLDTLYIDRRLSWSKKGVRKGSSETNRQTVLTSKRGNRTRGNLIKGYTKVARRPIGVFIRLPIRFFSTYPYQHLHYQTTTTTIQHPATSSHHSSQSSSLSTFFHHVRTNSPRPNSWSASA